MSALRYLLLGLSVVGACFVGADAMITGPKALTLVIFTALILNAIYLFVVEPQGEKRHSILRWIRKRRRSQ
jgi:hypothetical protein